MFLREAVLLWVMAHGVGQESAVFNSHRESALAVEIRLWDSSLAQGFLAPASSSIPQFIQSETVHYYPKTALNSSLHA